MAAGPGNPWTATVKDRGCKSGDGFYSLHFVLRSIHASLTLSEQMAKELIMVMGAQRSGTNALFCSLANDKRVTPYNESIDNAIYSNYRLRPEGEIASVLQAATGPVLLKPISETLYRTIEEVIEEFRGYVLRIVWIYRDPINVFYSMHQEGWIPFNEIGSDGYVEQWNRRNSLACESGARHSDLLAIVRYEDLLMDSRVFRSLCDWLGVRSKSSFRTDSEKGRRKVPAAIQHKVDLQTADTISTLNAARTFRPRLTRRLGDRFAKKFDPSRRRKTKKVRRGETGVEQGEWDALSDDGTPCNPSEIAGLRFWFDCPKNLQKTGGLTAELRENGPFQMPANGSKNGLYYISACINGGPALVFPAEKLETRREAQHGILEFGGKSDWSFMCDGSPFAVFAVFKPSVPGTAVVLQSRAILMRIGAAQGGGPAFVLQWNSDANASEGIMDWESASGNGMERQIASTPRGSHPHEQWRIIHVQHASDGTLLSFANASPGSPCPGKIRKAQASASSGGALHLGGAQGENESYFFGAVAEVIIFGENLSDQQRMGITGYLKKKYQL